MKYFNQIILPIVIFISFFSYGQEKTERWKMSQEQAAVIVNEALKDSTLHNVITNKLILKTEKQAIKYAEFVLFDRYGKANIERQKPYNIHKIRNYWLLTGTLPEGMIGGTFLIIIDARNCKIIRLSHGK